jgi:hypothetical protein
MHGMEHIKTHKIFILLSKEGSEKRSNIDCKDTMSTLASESPQSTKTRLFHNRRIQQHFAGFKE